MIEFLTINHSSKHLSNQSNIHNSNCFVQPNFKHSTTTMHFSLPTILAASSFFITGTSAAPAQDATAKALETRECNFQAHVDSVFNEDGLTRRRVVYSNSGGIDGKELGNLWLAEDALAST